MIIARRDAETQRTQLERRLTTFFKLKRLEIAPAFKLTRFEIAPAFKPGIFAEIFPALAAYRNSCGD